jgi:hypothetical protein
LLSTKPKRFRVSLRDDITGEFNYIIVVDVMYLSEYPVLHCVDVSTGFQSGMFLPDMSANTAWRALRRCWIDVYSGPPDRIVVDKGSNLAAASFHREAGKLSIKVRVARKTCRGYSIARVSQWCGVTSILLFAIFFCSKIPLPFYSPVAF